MADVCVIDMQGFMANKNEFIAKEVAVIHGKKQKIAHFAFMPPTNRHPDIQQQYFLENVHGIKWNSGYVLYELLQTVLQQVTKDFCKRKSEKRFFGKNLLNKHVINLEDFACPSLNAIRVSDEFQSYGLCDDNVECFYYSFEIMNCVLFYVMMLSHWCKTNLSV